ncbi:ankyrin repeat-containing domain protein [Rhexocercosporidium sp. MPI-PUGE-AT-0058]|nr:ankyrin repeat-containing domain protein [Rhexocercosporidium sp. MPI-PUGE-AT-0058]
MDPLSGVASLLTVIDAAVKAFGIAQSYLEAPCEINVLRLQLDALKTNLLLLRHVQSSVSFSRHALALESAEFDQLKHFFDATTIIIKDIRDCLGKYSTNTGRSARIKWAIRDSSKVQGWQLKLRRQENTLQLTLNLLNQVVCIDFKVRRQSLFSVEVSTAGVGVTLKNIVPDHAAIMTACKAGDIRLVQSLLNGGEASVNDVTMTNFSPFSHAIASGSLDIVMFLVERGADPKQTFGRSQTSSLEWAFSHRNLPIARWLLHKEADAHYISARGWTAAFGLFGDAPMYKAPCDEFLDCLASASFVDLDAQDGEGWSVMHRAAAYGTAEQIRSLIYRGASLETRTRHPGWTPAFCAVQFNNISTLKEMIESEPQVLEVTDFLLENRQLTPMDVARAHGSLIFHCYLEALGAKEHDIQIIEDEEAGLPDVFWLSSEDQSGEDEVIRNRIVARKACG